MCRPIAAAAAPIVFANLPAWRRRQTEEKAKKELADKAKAKGPLNTGNQGIKKSGKK